MHNFESTLIVSPLPDGKTWVIRSGFFYESHKAGRIDVPVGFETDFASVPRLLWWVFSPWGVYGNAAVIHDWLYWDQSPSRNRETSDDIFLEGMEALKVGAITKYCLYYAVRLFGWLAWWRNAQLKRADDKRICQGLAPLSVGQPLAPPAWRNRQLYRASAKQAEILKGAAAEYVRQLSQSAKTRWTRPGGGR